ncbi:MAG: 5-methyltetrahydropteroyltriglutamate--homocysteine S-methyltransferase [Anaerolineaceae bacterium]|nr:5-methyltetrahydropteroyltriglutamate--homocysteine S-methyltransferase [Anaerolineaceae bacterium]
MKTHILGFPRIGVNRELKRALESYWKGNISKEDLQSRSQQLRNQHWTIQKEAGLTYVSSADFSLYDQMLDTSAMLGAVPLRFGTQWDHVDLDLYFKMARGDAAANLPAMEMTKWFDTNYHYIVPEISHSFAAKFASRKVIEETHEALAAGFKPKPVLIGPISYLSLAKGMHGFNPWHKFEQIIQVYTDVIAELSSLCDWIQMDEPVLCSDMSDDARKYFLPAYQILNQAASQSKLMLTTYFDAIDEHLDLALGSGCAGLHLDLVRGKRQIENVLHQLPDSMLISAGIVDGRNVWKTDFQQTIPILNIMKEMLGSERLMIGSSCSLLHSPMDLEQEKILDNEIKNWMSFAVQKCAEVNILAEVLEGGNNSDAIEANIAAIKSRSISRRVHNEDVRARCAEIVPEMLQRQSEYANRKMAQSWLALPLFPTTTIGSFPQTAEIRIQRNRFRKGEITTSQYESFIRDEIRHVVKQQEQIGLDVLVHGEAERNDMVEYFGQQLDGFCFTENGWVQSYGSRCVKPPIIFGDVERQSAMTVDYLTLAQSLTEKPMKGMLTGPVTILCWSFVRDDLARSAVCQQIALAIRDEVSDLEAAGIRIIQIDEPAFREGLPIKNKNRQDYLTWAVQAFRLATTGVEDATQIHTHMCYSEFNQIIEVIADMDADVISIESSRSKMELLDAFQIFEYPNEIGPGVYDIHSPRIPSVEEMVVLIEKALERIPAERLWVNPDCGLKTRGWPEATQALINMVNAAKDLRKKYPK